MKSLGIDIGSCSIKVVEINASSKGFQLVQFYQHQLSLLPNSDIHFETIEFLREITQKYDPENTKFIVGIKQDKVATRGKTFPFTDRNKISKTLPLELEEEIPFNIDHAVFDFKINKITPPNAEILAFITKKESIQNAIQLLKESGIQIDILSTEGSAFANLFENWSQAVSPSIPPLPQVVDAEGLEPSTPLRHINLVLNIGHSQSLLAVFENNRLIQVRSILWGGKLIGEQIAKRFNLPISEAHKELNAKGFILTKKQEISHEAKVFSEIISKGVKELIKDLQISFLEIKSEFNCEISRLEVTGGMSMVQGICPFLTQFLEVPCNKLNTLDNYPHLYFEKNESNEALLGVATGLAIEGLKKPRNPAINFLKDEFAKENHKFKKLWSRWGSTVQISFTLLVCFYVWSFLRIDFSEVLAETAKSNLKEVAKKAIGVSSKNATTKNIEKYIKENRKTVSDIKSAEIYYQMNSAMEVLRKVSDHLPNKSQVKLDIKKFEVVDQKVSVEGYVNSSLEMEVTKELLKSYSLDDKIVTQASSLPPLSQRVAFHFVFNVDRGISKEK